MTLLLLSRSFAQVLFIVVEKNWVPYSWRAGAKQPRCKHLPCACTRWCKEEELHLVHAHETLLARSNTEEPWRANRTPDYNLKLQSMLCRGAGGAAFLKNAISTYLEEDPWLSSMPSACGESARAARAAAACWGISWEGTAATKVAIEKGENQDNMPRGPNQLLW